ncbi:hypothetical protein ACJZ2D_007375 [Fusarium nematophilum]
MGVSRTDDVQPAEVRPVSIDVEKNVDANADVADVSSDKGHETDGSERFQDGIQRVRAISTIWSKPTLITMFLLIMSTALGGCIPLATAKVIDIWGRVEGFFFMLILTLIGMIMKATCKNMETYVAAHVLYWAGHIGILYVIDVMCADITTLKNRMIIFGINGTPRIASTFAGPAIGELFYKNSSFRWAFGAFAIILFACSIPAMGVMVYMFLKARKAGLIKKQRSDRTVFQSIKYYFIQFDAIGILLIMFAFCLFLLPFSLVAYAPNGWKTPYIIAMVVLGILLFPAFVAWEKYLAPVQFLSWKYLKQGTIVGSCLLYGVMFLSIMCWNGYFYSYLQVVHRQSITHAGYILNSFSLTSSVFGPIIGMIISWTGDFKYLSYTGVPIMLLGTALLIPFRDPDTSPGVLAITQVLCGLGTGIFAMCGQLAVMAPVTHQEIAAVNALWGLFGGFGAAIGYAIAGALWNNLLPQELYNRLPEETKPLAGQIFGDMVAQMSYADGTPEREAIVAAYSHVMRLMVIAGSCFVPLCLASIFIWKNINVKKLEEEQGKQTKGTVF